MRTRSSLATLSITGLLASMALAACGSDDNGGSSASSTDGGTDNTAACSLDNPPKSQAPPAPSPDPKAKATGKVGVILPDTTSSTRYTLYDAPLLKEALSNAGITPDVQNANGSTSKFASIASNMIGAGSKVLIIDSIDIPSGVGVEKQATDAGVKTIEYDRANLGGTAPYYVSFDNEEVGELQAQALVDCLTAAGVTKPKIMLMNGGTDVDNNAVLFRKGAHTVLDALQAKGDAEIVSDTTVTGWKIETAAPKFTQALTSVGGEVDGVVAANDDIANAVIGVLKSNGLDGHVAVTGQDAGVEGLQNIIKGVQSMTIFKNVELEADAASALAISLIQGTDPADAGMTLVPFDDPEKPNRDLKAQLLPPQVITQANIQDVIDSGALKLSDVCKNIEDDCAKLGLQ